MSVDITGLMTILGEEVLDSTTYAPLAGTQASCTIQLYDEISKASETAQTADITYVAADDVYTLDMNDINSVLNKGNKYTGLVSHAGMVTLSVDTFEVSDGKDSQTNRLVRQLKNADTSVIATAISGLRNLVQSVFNKVNIQEKEQKKVSGQLRELIQKTRSKDGNTSE